MASLENVSTALRQVVGIAELAGQLGREITSLTQEVHAASSPVAVASGRRPARIVYGSIRSAFRATEGIAARSGRWIGRDPQPGTALDVQSALNGAFGHRLADEGAYTLPMTFLTEPNECRAKKRLILFVHGLCMNESAWDNEEHRDFVDWARGHLGARVAHLRYNTGLHISQNGALLADLMEHKARDRDITLVGHSMGGLVSLSALHQARERGLDWPIRVAHVACLGSPHQGARLERIGNAANRLLDALPWSRPFARLGNLRSDGIRDLRFGHLLEQDWQGRAPDDPERAPSAVALAPSVEHLFVAATRSDAETDEPIGDWLVTPRSALALDVHRHATVARETVHELDHLGLLSDGRVTQTLREWLVPA